MPNILHNIHEHLQQMKQLYTAFKCELQTLPSGSLYTQERNQSIYYYHCYKTNGKWKRSFLRTGAPEDLLLIKQLQRRRFIQDSLPILEADIAALEQAVQKLVPYDPEQICKDLPPAYQSIQYDKTLWLPCSPDLRAWAGENYWRSNSRPEDLIHETICGLMVRSKSEAMITDMLCDFGIPFRYEQILVIGKKHYAPDFTVLRPKDQRLMYWEHFGKMDDPDYVTDMASKVMDYRKSGIRAGQNFIQTYEDKKHPLTSREIYDTITSQLL